MASATSKNINSVDVNQIAEQSGLYNFQISNNVLLASWNDSLSVESVAFIESLKHLFWVASEYGITRVLLDSGTPAGGTLTEELISFVQNNLAFVAVHKIGLLESADFHWDNNLFQFLQYLQVALNLNFEVKMFACRSIALDWLTSDCSNLNYETVTGDPFASENSFSGI